MNSKFTVYVDGKKDVYQLTPKGCLLAALMPYADQNWQIDLGTVLKDDGDAIVKKFLKLMEGSGYIAPYDGERGEE